VPHQVRIGRELAKRYAPAFYRLRLDEQAVDTIVNQLGDAA